MLFLTTLPAAERVRPDAQALEQCLARIADGDRSALEPLYAQTRTALYGYALSLLRDRHDAQDVLHDCYVGVWSAAAAYRPQGKPLAWLLTITRNLCLLRLRERKRAEHLPPEELAALPHTARDGTDDRLMLSAVLETLTEEEREIVTLHAVSGFRHREIAELLALPLPTVLSKYHRALRKLKKQLEEDEQP